MMNRPMARTSRLLCCAFGAVLLLNLAGTLSGCGAEGQTPVAAPTGGATPGGVSSDDYKTKMMEMQKGGKPK